MYDAILIPTDGSAGTTATVNHALAIAENHGSTVHALYVVDRRHYHATSDEGREDVVASLRAEGEEAIGEIERTVSERGLEVVTTVREGIPHKDILRYADEHEVDLIVMGTHGRTGRDRLATLGSVTDRVVGHADRPVLVVDIGGEE